MLCKSQTPCVDSQKEQNTCMGILKYYSLTSCSLEVGSLKGNDRQGGLLKTLSGTQKRKKYKSAKGEGR